MARVYATQRSSLLRTVLRANAAFSTISGLSFILLNQPIAELIGIQGETIFNLLNGELFLIVVGAGLLPFAGFLWWFAMQQNLTVQITWGIITADFAWVIASAVILLVGLLPLTNLGKWGVLIIADTVLIFALLQIWGLRRMSQMGGAS